MKVTFREDDRNKYVESEYYNSVLDKSNGKFLRWGKTLDDDPKCGPGPEILDLEISTSVQEHEMKDYPQERLTTEGGCKGSCYFCYKSNSRSLPVYNMNLEEFKIIFHKMPKTLQSIAFGLMNIDTNPDFFAMARYARANGVMPTFTMHGLDDISDETIKEIVDLFGACAVSVYDRDKSYNLIKRLTDAGMEQVNIHFMLSARTYGDAMSIVEDDMVNDKRLANLNAIVFLSLKQKGKAKDNNLYTLDVESFESVIDSCLKLKIRFGFDSCSANKFMKAIIDHPNEEQLRQMSEPCESTLFSAYINARGVFYACSFCEGEGNWKIGQSVLNGDFMEIWNSEQVKRFRKKLYKTGRSCPMFNV